MTEAAPLTEVRLADYRELAKMGSAVGVGGTLLTELLDEIDRDRLEIERLQFEFTNSHEAWQHASDVIQKQDEQITALREKLTRAREGLEPFKKMYDGVIARNPLNYEGLADSVPCVSSAHVGDLRKASEVHALLSTAEKENG